MKILGRLVLCAVLWLGGGTAEGLGQAAGAATRPAVPPTFEFRDGDRVAFLGDTWVEREQSYGYIEARLTSRLVGKRVIFRNLAWSADTVLGESRAGFDAPEKGFDRLKEQLEAIKPTVALLGYGMAHSFEGEPGLERFRADMKKLLETIEDISPGVRFIFCSPLRHENLGGGLPNPARHNEQLKLYSEALRGMAEERKAHFIPLFDLWSPVREQTGPPLTDNGIHPTARGYWRLATFIEQGLGLSPVRWRVGITGEGTMREGSTGLDVAEIQKHRTSVRFEGEDRFLATSPAPAYRSRTNDWPGNLMQFVDLDGGRYTLTVDGEPVASFTSEEWARGKSFFRGPHFRQVEQLREAIVQKNELFFHRWRPQNQTYLFGFRKYEQGQNAKEIPMFDPLISEAEGRIFALASLKKRTYELRPYLPADDAALAAPIMPPKPVAPVSFQQPSMPKPDFTLGEGLELTLFAENPNLAKPIHMNFDPEGRLWVASSEVYPQIQPGQAATDKILVIEDTDRDGKADKSTVFADGLLIPTGVEPGDGGAYVANSTELVFFKDTDGDGRADSKRIMLSGFGTEDTHHILHTLRWGHDGQLYMNQSIYIHSHVETPHGVVRLDSGGIWNFRPSTYELGIHMKGLVNSWGHHFDKFGQSFVTDGAGGEGINWVIPQAMYVTYEGARRIMNSVSPGSHPKFCGIEVIESEHFPADWQGSIVTCDFRANRVVRFTINEKDAGYITQQQADLIRTTDVSFRPVDVKIGPDGALYFADWSNPVIQHGEVDFRDPRRDHVHGRIWRLAYKGRAKLSPPDLRKTESTALLDLLLSPNGHLRQQARRVLTERGAAVKSALDAWTLAQAEEGAQLEALWMYQSLDLPNTALLDVLLQAKDGRIRAAAVRVLSFWRNRVPNPIEALSPRVADEHPRVRLEAVRAVAKIPAAQSAELVLSALDRPMDRFLDYAIWLSINDLAHPWVEAVKSGAWKFEGREKQLEFALKAIEPAQASGVLKQVLAGQKLSPDGPWIDLIASAGGPEELGLLFEEVRGTAFPDAVKVRALRGLGEAARLRQARPQTGQEGLPAFFEHANAEVRAVALRLAGLWKQAGTAPQLLALAAKENPAPVREAVFQSLRELGGETVVSGLTELAGDTQPLGIRVEAVKALAAIDLAKGAPLAATVAAALDSEEAALGFWRGLLAQRGAAPVLAQALPKSGLPAPVAKAGLRAAREGGRNEPNLVVAFSRNLEGEGAAVNLSPAEVNRLVSFVREKGDPVRGEKLYRRAEFACVTCHSIGGAGGKAGPDLTSIGASAPADYLIESVLFPNRKVKEGFHSVVIETNDGEEVSGILVRENSEQVVLRDASNREVSIPKNNVQKRAVGGSIMPAGLIDGLGEQEQADLYRFLTELGKPGPFDASKGNVARSWRLMARTIDLAQFPDEKIATMDHSNWDPAVTLVDGRLPKELLEASIRRLRYRNPEGLYAVTQFEAAKAGPVTLEFPRLEKAALWIDGQAHPIGPRVTVDLPAGRHTLVLRLDAGTFPEYLTAGASDATFVNN